MKLTIEEELTRTDLAQKLKKGEITIAEAHELRNLLEKEKHIISWILINLLPIKPTSEYELRTSIDQNSNPCIKLFNKILFLRL